MSRLSNTHNPERLIFDRSKHKPEEFGGFAESAQVPDKPDEDKPEEVPIDEPKQ